MHSTLTISSHSLSCSLQMNDTLQHGQTTTKHTKSENRVIKLYFSQQPRDDFLTVNRLINTTVTAHRQSKLAKTTKPPEYNRPSLLCSDYHFLSACYVISMKHNLTHKMMLIYISEATSYAVTPLCHIACR